jgi:tetratricopeptide (TPR) repeat protein
MAESVYGRDLDQLQVAADLKPDREDTNVTPDELAALARRHGLSALVRYDGNGDKVRALVRTGVPVIAEQWIDIEGRGEMGHYRVVTGFDDARSVFLVQDSYYGANRTYSYDDFERMWRPFLGVYVVVYEPPMEGAVRAALGADADEAAMWQRAVADQEERARRDPGDAWASFALGEALSRVGRNEEAVAAFDRAMAVGLPFRAFWYQFGYYRSLAATAQYERIVSQADATLATMKGENLEESRYWRGVALRALGREAEAEVEFQTALFYNPLYQAARDALAASPTGTPEASAARLAPPLGWA